MLGKYIEIDGVKYPNPTATSIAYENNEKINKSEAGTDLVTAVRLLKINITFTFQVSSFWKKKILTDCQKLGVLLNFGGNPYNGRLRCTADVLAPNSEDSSGTDGYWTLTVVFSER